jgi:hypothetical protein
MTKKAENGKKGGATMARFARFVPVGGATEENLT